MEWVSKSQVKVLPNFQPLVWVHAHYPSITVGNLYGCGIKVQSILSLDSKGRNKGKPLKLKSYYLLPIYQPLPLV